MRERLQLVGGEFFIQSEPAHGSTICARVPLRPDEIRHGAPLPKGDAAAAGRNI
jgi:signal transduction histidine kinase